MANGKLSLPVATLTKTKLNIQQTALVGIAAVATAALLGAFTAQFASAIAGVRIAATTISCTNPANLACGKPVTSVAPPTSYWQKAYTPERVTDGNRTTYSTTSDWKMGYEINLKQSTEVAKLVITWGRWGFSPYTDGKRYMNDYYVYGLSSGTWTKLAGKASAPNENTTTITLTTPVKIEKLRVTSGWGLQADGRWGIKGFNKAGNTLGLFEENIGAIAEIVHSKGGFVYCDGANQNALVGQARVGDMGVDVLHFNLHKTFTTPHGGGGPGSGPVAVKQALAPFLPVPRVVKKGKAYTVEYHAGESIGRVKSFFGNFGMLVRAYTYIREMGFEGLKLLSQMAVLNANYLRQALREDFFLPYDGVCMHECVFTDKWQNEQGVKTLDIAKRLMDYGFHPPTVYFPLVVAGSLMVEPTETESKETLDSFITAMKAIAQEAKTTPEQLTSAPKLTALRRLDEVKAVRELKLVWKP